MTTEFGLGSNRVFLTLRDLLAGIAGNVCGARPTTSCFLYTETWAHEIDMDIEETRVAVKIKSDDVLEPLDGFKSHNLLL